MPIPYLPGLMGYTATPTMDMPLEMTPLPGGPNDFLVNDAIDVTSSPMGIPPSMAQMGIEPILPPGLSPAPLGPASPGIIQAEGPAGPHSALTPKPGLWDRMIAGAPTFGMDRLSENARRDAIMAGLLRFGGSMMAGVQPGQQNPIGNVGQSLDYGLSGYQDALGIAEKARLAENSQRIDRRRQEHLIGRDNREEARYEEAGRAAGAERERVYGNLAPEQQAAMDPFMGADEKTFYAQLGRTLTAPDADRELRNAGGKLYRVGEEGPAELVPGIEYPEKGEGGEQAVSMDEIMTEARQMAKIEFDSIQKRDTEAGKAGDKYIRSPSDTFEKLVEKWVGKLRSEYGFREGGTSSTEQTPGAAETPSSALDQGIDGLGLPPEVAQRWKAKAAELRAQGKSEEEIATLINQAMTVVSGG